MFYLIYLSGFEVKVSSRHHEFKWKSNFIRTKIKMKTYQQNPEQKKNIIM